MSILTSHAADVLTVSSCFTPQFSQLYIHVGSICAYLFSLSFQSFSLLGVLFHGNQFEGLVRTPWLADWAHELYLQVFHSGAGVTTEASRSVNNTNLMVFGEVRQTTCVMFEVRYSEQLPQFYGN
ncbi:hypothetical protein B0H19DRAFT_1083149 [Mycena capillaripes]|nr:hypothetical protein B0H19DRAFT_1083149 [Mycena capillaripes]